MIAIVIYDLLLALANLEMSTRDTTANIHLGPRPLLWICLLVSIDFIGQVCSLFLLVTMNAARDIYRKNRFLLILILAAGVYGLGPGSCYTQDNFVIPPL